MRELPNSENISWLANASNYSSHLRQFLLQSLVKKSFDLHHLGITTNFISDLSKLENGGGSKQGSNHSPKSKLKRPHVPRSALSSVDSSSSSCSFPQSSLSPPDNAKNLSKSEDDPNPNSINSANDSSPPSISDFSNSLGVQTSPKRLIRKQNHLYLRNRQLITSKVTLIMCQGRPYLQLIRPLHHVLFLSLHSLHPITLRTCQNLKMIQTQT